MKKRRKDVFSFVIISKCMHPLCGVTSRLKKVVIKLQRVQDDEVF